MIKEFFSEQSDLLSFILWHVETDNKSHKSDKSYPSAANKIWEFKIQSWHDVTYELDKEKTSCSYYYYLCRFIERFWISMIIIEQDFAPQDENSTDRLQVFSDQDSPKEKCQILSN